MKVYLDYIFVQNFLIDLIIITETGTIAKRKSNYTRQITAAIIGSAYVIIMIFFKIQELSYIYCKVLLAFAVVYIAFKPERMLEYLKLVALFILTSVVNVGSVSIIENFMKIDKVSYMEEITIYLIGLALAKCIMKHMWKMYRVEIKKDELIYKVKIKIGENEYRYKAFLDTGNSVYSFTQKVPIIFAEKTQGIENALKEQSTPEFYIKTSTLSTVSERKAYLLDNIEISHKNKSWYVKAGVCLVDTKFSKTGEYNMILNYILYTENMEGIKI